MGELYIGFMSGTSLDGVDASLIRTDGFSVFDSIENLHISYPEGFRNEMRVLLTHFGPFLHLEKQLTEFHIKATRGLLDKAKLSSKDIKAIGFHGQTLFHKPRDWLTLQIGNPYLLSQKTGIDVIYDFRRRDMALGGQGAPLVPIFHKLLVQDKTCPVAILNIGGVANISYIDSDKMIAFDTGPGIALIDDAMLEYFSRPFDKHGEIAASGTVDKFVVDKILSNKYFSSAYPKSLDRNEFSFLKKDLARHRPEDIISTLAYITSASIVKALNLLPNMPQELFVCGGGSKNLQIISRVEEILLKQGDKCIIQNISTINNLDPDYIESQAFAYLAARFFQGVPSTFPMTTGSSKPSISGSLVRV